MINSKQNLTQKGRISMFPKTIIFTLVSFVFLIIESIIILIAIPSLLPWIYNTNNNGSCFESISPSLSSCHPGSPILDEQKLLLDLLIFLALVFVNYFLLKTIFKSKK
ncbi:hypothetical protein BH10PAT1_BH10PAT1_5490 [soil metagenome]